MKLMDKGFVILAQNTKSTSYTDCAEKLAMSIKQVMPDASVAIITNNRCDWSVFDYEIELPHGDLAPDSDWKLINDWQVYEASPYEYTIKLEADMYLPKSIEYWWDILYERDIVVSTTIRDFKQNISDARTYRKFIDDNKLPDCYNAITYFKKSDMAKQFFDIVKNVFENWKEWKASLKCNPDEEVTTDWAYAIACHVLGVENTTLPQFKEMSMVHMKQWVNGLPTENWTDILAYEILPHTLRVNTYPQQYPFHYHIKSFADKLGV